MHWGIAFDTPPTLTPQDPVPVVPALLQRPSRLAIIWVSVAWISVGCGDQSGSTDPGFQADTLPGGAVLVRNADEGRWARMDQDGWTLGEDLRIGRVEGDGPDVFGHIRNVIPGTAGTIWALDSQARELRQFGPDGAFLRTVGGPGDGPGEFGGNTCAFAGPHGEIWVESGGRWQRFNAGGELIGEQQVTRSLGCGIFAWRGEELAVAFSDFDPATQEFSSAFVLHDRLQDGTVTVRDTVPAPRIEDGPMAEWFQDGRLRRTARLPLAQSPGYFLQHGGVFWVTDGGGAYRFRRQTLEGDTLMIVERPHEPVPVPDSIRDAEIEGLYWEGVGYPEGFNPSDVPGVFPPFERIIEAEDGTVWVRRQVHGGDVSFDVFHASGEFLGNVPLPPGLRAFIEHWITESHVYGVARDELDVQYIVRLRIGR